MVCTDGCCGDFEPRIILQDEEEGLDHLDELSFRDLRSEARDGQRARKHLKKYNRFRHVTPMDCPSHPEQQAHYIPTCQDLYPTPRSCEVRPRGTFPVDLSTAPTAKFTKREAYKAAQQACPQRFPRKFTNPSFKFTRRRSKQKELTLICNKLWLEDIDLNDSLQYSIEDHYNFLQWETDCFEGQSWIHEAETNEDKMAILSGHLEIGETFERWCRRRIDEMRAVKEARLRVRAKLPARKPPPTPSQSTSFTPQVSYDADDDEGYYSSSSSSAPKTTLPTTLYDAHGHTLLKSFLGLPTWYLAQRDQDDYSWFEEYSWYWHRNEMGCWYILDWQCGEDNSLCFCDEWKDEKWKGWDPEGGRRVWLAEYLAGGGWEGLWNGEGEVEADAEGVKRGGAKQCDIESVHDEEMEGEWDLISILSTTSSWSEIDSPFDFKTI
jgi:hypothetical protein